MYTVMALWVIWGLMSFALLTTNATIQGYTFVKEVWADYNDTDYQKPIVVTVKDPVKVLEVVASCESGERAGITPGRQFYKNGSLVYEINTNNDRRRLLPN